MPRKSSKVAPTTEPAAATVSLPATASAPRGRASWSGILRLSLVAVPVKAYPATSSSDAIHFNQLHADCGQRIAYEKRCPIHGAVEAAEIVKGYQYASGQYVIIEAEELESLRSAREKALSLERFVDAREIDPIVFSGRCLYLLPESGPAHRSYLLLAQAMRARHRWAIGRVVMSGHRHAVMVRPLGRLLLMDVLHDPGLLRSTAWLEGELAVQSQPFDSEEHLFEVKWDGVRALTAVEASCCRVWGRKLADYSQRYPELDALHCLPDGTVLDGELVMLRSGRAELGELLRRHQLVSCRMIQEASRLCPVTYIVFDLLYDSGRSLLGRPLSERRQRLQELVARHPESRLAFSDGVVGAGRDFFERVVEQGHEGVMAKQLASRYLPGKRGQAWRKIKPFQTLPCVVIGYTSSRRGIRTLLVAAAGQGKLQYVAELTAGFTDEAKAQLVQLLSRQSRAEPVVPCPKRAHWVEPQVYCHVRFLEWTAHGRLRGAHFRGVIPP